MHKGLPPNYKEKIVTYEEVVNMPLEDIEDEIKNIIVNEEDEDEDDDDEILVQFR